jgi:hypothetical protein
MTAGLKLDTNLLKYCNSDQELIYLNTTVEVGSMTGAAKKLGVNYGTIHQAIDRVKVRAAKMGYAPEHDMVHPTTSPHYVRGTSTLYDDSGNAKLQWVKTDIDKDKLDQILLQFIEGATESIPKEKPNKSKPKTKAPDLVHCMVITDYHAGMLAWSEETRGEDWDLKIAEDLLVKWFKHAIENLPDAAGVVLCFLGDDLHWDSVPGPLTPASAHLLDADGRFPKVVRMWIKVRRRINQMLLDRFPWVHMIEAEGNHNPTSSVWMREWMTALYEDEPRVTVDQSVDPYYCFEWGNTSLFFHHGHKKKLNSIDDVFVAKFREVFGRTKHSYAHMGHLHHRHELESNLMVVTQHRTLAAADAYASRGGWISGREAQIMTYHKEYGEVGRMMISPEMVQ